MLATKNATKTGALALFCVPRHVFGAVRSWGTRFRELFFATAAGTTMKRGFPNPPPNPPHLEIAGRRRRLKLGEKPNIFHQCRKLVPLALLLRASLLRVRACACACCVARIRCFRAFVAVRPCVPLLQFLPPPSLRNVAGAPRAATTPCSRATAIAQQCVRFWWCCVHIEQKNIFFPKKYSARNSASKGSAVDNFLHYVGCCFRLTKNMHRANSKKIHFFFRFQFWGPVPAAVAAPGAAADPGRRRTGKESITEIYKKCILPK